MEDSNRECLGSSSCLHARMNGVWIHTTATNSTTLTLHLGFVTPRPTFLFCYICAPPTLRAWTVRRAAYKPSGRAWNVKLPSMTVDKAAGNSHSFQRPEVRVPPLRENTVRAIFLWRLLPLNTLTGVLQAQSLPTLWPMRTFIR